MRLLVILFKFRHSSTVSLSHLPVTDRQSNMSKRGTRYDPADVKAIKPGSFSDNIFSQVTETLTPSDETIEHRLKLATKKISIVRKECQRMQRITEALNRQATAALENGDRKLAHALIVQRAVYDQQISKCLAVLQTLQATKASVDVAKTNVESAESFKLLDSVLSEFKQSVSKQDAEYILTDLEKKSRQVDERASVLGQAVTEDQKAAEKSAEEELAILENKLTDRLALEMPSIQLGNVPRQAVGAMPNRVTADNGGSGRNRGNGRGGNGSGGGGGGGGGEVSAIRIREPASGSSVAISEAEFADGGGTQSLEYTRGGGSGSGTHKKKPRNPTPPPPQMVSFRYDSMDSQELESILPVVSTQKPLGRRPPTPPPFSSREMVPGGSPPPFDHMRHSRGAGAEGETGRQNTPSPRQRQEAQHEETNDGVGEDYDNDNEEIPLERKSKRKGREGQTLKKKKRREHQRSKTDEFEQSHTAVTSGMDRAYYWSPATATGPVVDREEHKDPRAITKFESTSSWPPFTGKMLRQGLDPTASTLPSYPPPSNRRPIEEQEAMLDDLLIDDE